MLHIRSMFVIAPTLLVLVALVQCGGPSASQRAAGEGVLRTGNHAEPESLDPQLVQSVYSARITTQLFEGLVVLDPETLEPQPGVAESWDVSDDGSTYTFHIRNDALWSNDDPVTAQDFIYSWKRILTPEFASQYSYMLYPMKNAEDFNTGVLSDFGEVGAKAINENTIQVILGEPTPYFLTLHAHQTWFPVHRATIEAHGRMDERNTRWTRPENIVGNGPYILTAWRPNDVVSVRPSSTYWNRGALRNKGVDFLPVESEQTEERMFRAGEMDMTETMPLTKVEYYRKNNPEVLRIDDLSNIAYVFANCKRKPFDDSRVRRAFSMAFDRKLIAEKIRQGVYEPAYFFTPTGINGYVPPTKIDENIDEARRLLADAGYPGGKGFPEVEFYYNTSDSGRYLTEAFQQMWETNLGVRVQILNQEWKVFLDTTARGEYDIAVMAWMADYLDPIGYLELFTTDNGNNRSEYSNPEYDALIAQSRVTLDNDARNKLFGEAESILLNDSPIFPVYFKRRAFLCSPRVTNFPPNILDYRRYDLMGLTPADT